MTKIIVWATILSILYGLSFQAYAPLIKEATEIVKKLNHRNDIFLNVINNHENK